jgi:transposase
MHPNVRQAPRRVHSAEFKVKVMAQCREPGASVAAVAMAHGVNANVVRKWLAGHGLKRCARSEKGDRAAAATTQACAESVLVQPVSVPMGFLPVKVAAVGSGEAESMAPATSEAITPGASSIQVEVRRGDVSVVVRWPASQAHGCVAWLNDLAGAVLKG